MSKRLEQPGYAHDFMGEAAEQDYRQDLVRSMMRDAPGLSKGGAVVLADHHMEVEKLGSRMADPLSGAMGAGMERIGKRFNENVISYQTALRDEKSRVAKAEGRPDPEGFDRLQRNMYDAAYRGDKALTDATRGKLGQGYAEYKAEVEKPNRKMLDGIMASLGSKAGRRLPENGEEMLKQTGQASNDAEYEG